MIRTWTYRGFEIESNPNGRTYLYVVWIAYVRVIAGRTLGELEADIDALLEAQDAA